MQSIPKPTHGSINWLNIRHRDDKGKCTFGASEAGALLGVSQFQTTADLFTSKLNEPTVIPPTAAMLKGIYFEAGLGQFASERLGMELVQPDEMFRRGRWTATLDYWNRKVGVIVECKVTNAHRIQTSDDLPMSWVAQGHIQQWVTGMAVQFATFDASQQLNLVPMLYDDELMDELLRRSEELGQAVDNGVAPDWLDDQMSEQNIRQVYRPETGATVEANNELMLWIQDLSEAKKLKKQAEEAEKFARDMIARFMKTNEAITYEGRTVLTWKEQAGRASFDAERFRAEHPDLAAQYEKQGSPIRVMRLGRGQ
jgi:predicted phage-related endonuclease